MKAILVKIAAALLGTSWRTSLTGYLGVAVYAVIEAVRAGTVETDKLLLAAVLAVGLRFAKDAGATGAGK